MADFGGNVEETYIYTYAKNLAFKAQQMNSRLFNYVLSDSSMEAGGKLHKVEQQWFPTSLDEKTTRFQDTNLTEMQSENRWYRFKDFNKAIGIDESDVKRSLQDPQSAATQTLSMAWARKMDEVVKNAFFGDAIVGEDGDETKAFKSSNIVEKTVGDTTGLNVEKILAGMEILKASDYLQAGDMVTCPVTARQWRDLMKELKYTNIEYANSKTLPTGILVPFLGVNFVEYQGLDKDSEGNFLVPLYVKRAMFIGTPGLKKIRVGERADKSFANQIYIEGSVGATRLDEDGVVQIKCAAE